LAARSIPPARQVGRRRLTGALDEPARQRPARDGHLAGELLGGPRAGRLVVDEAHGGADNRVAQRLELPGTLVTGLVLSATDTDLMAGWDIPKNDARDAVRAALDGLEAGATEVIADQDTADAKAAPAM
jgi:hypothetical protein